MPRLTLTLLASTLVLAIGAPAAAAADCPGADLTPGAANVVEARAAVLCLTNAERAAAGLAPLAAEGRLEAAAQAFSNRMVLERFFEHVAPDGATLTDRLVDYVGWRLVGENIAWGEGSLATPRKIVEGWMASPGHRANILTAGFTQIGVGVALGTPSSTRPGATWTQDFGAPRDDSAPAPVEGDPGVATVTPRVLSSSRTTTKKAVTTKCRRGTTRRVSRSRAGKRLVRCVVVRSVRRR